VGADEAMTRYNGARRRNKRRQLHERLDGMISHMLAIHTDVCTIEHNLGELRTMVYGMSRQLERLDMYHSRSMG